MNFFQKMLKGLVENPKTETEEGVLETPPAADDFRVRLTEVLPVLLPAVIDRTNCLPSQAKQELCTYLEMIAAGLVWFKTQESDSTRVYCDVLSWEQTNWLWGVANSLRTGMSDSGVYRSCFVDGAYDTFVEDENEQLVLAAHALFKLFDQSGESSCGTSTLTVWNEIFFQFCSEFLKRGKFGDEANQELLDWLHQNLERKYPELSPSFHQSSHEA